MSDTTYADGAESTTTMGSTHNGLFTPATELNDDASIGIWIELGQGNATHDPVPGDILIMVDKTYGRVLSRHPAGHLILDNVSEYETTNRPIPMRWKWLCTDTDNFIGFRNLDQDAFLGRDDSWNLVARATAQKGHENFMLVKQRGGYRIQCPHWYGFRPLSARADGAGVEVQPSNGTVWGFIQASE